MKIRAIEREAREARARGDLREAARLFGLAATAWGDRALWWAMFSIAFAVLALVLAVVGAIA